MRRGEALTAEIQRHNIRVAAQALAPIATGHELIITHGNGPQVGLLALQSAAYDADGIYPLDILGAESEGMIGYLIEQELGNVLPELCPCAALLTQVEVDPADPAFQKASKPIGPVYNAAEAHRLARERGWRIAQDGAGFRRVVASPRPQRILELGIINRLVGQGVLVICAGGGGIPVARREDGSLIGVEAVIDKDLAAALLARELKAEALLMLTDVAAVYQDWSRPEQRAIRRISPSALNRFNFAEGSMGPKIQAACEFVAATGGIAGIGLLKDALAILDGVAGTRICADAAGIVWWD